MDVALRQYLFNNYTTPVRDSHLLIISFQQNCLIIMCKRHWLSLREPVVFLPFLQWFEKHRYCDYWVKIQKLPIRSHKCNNRASLAHAMMLTSSKQGPARAAVVPPKQLHRFTSLASFHKASVEPSFVCHAGSIEAVCTRCANQAQVFRS